MRVRQLTVRGDVARWLQPPVVSYSQVCDPSSFEPEGRYCPHYAHHRCTRGCHGFECRAREDARGSMGEPVGLDAASEVPLPTVHSDLEALRARLERDYPGAEWAGYRHAVLWAGASGWIE
jgi:hypothetical protein